MISANNLIKINRYLSILVKEVFREYQKDWLDSMLNNKYTGILSSRQLGKSLTIAIASLYLALGYEDSAGKTIKGHNVFIVSKDARTSKNIIATINKQIDTIEKIFKIKIRSTKLGGIQEVFLLNNTKITSMPGTQSALQGFTGTVIIDELSANSWDCNELMAQAESVTIENDNYKIITCTNADVEGSYVHNFWYSDSEFWSTKRTVWKLFNLNIYDAYPDGLPDKILRVKASMAKSMWLRFFENTFLGEGTGLLETDYLRSRLLPNRFDLMDNSWDDGINLLGIDPGFSQTGNPTGIAIVNIKDGKVTVIHEDLWFSPTIDELIDRVGDLKRKYNVKGIKVDQGIFMDVRERLKLKFGDFIVEGMSVSGHNQYSWFHTIISLLEERKLNFVHDKFVIQDLSSISIATDGNSGKYKLIVPERPLSVYKTKDAVLLPNTQHRIHADSAMALLILIPDIIKYTSKNQSFGFKQVSTSKKSTRSKFFTR